MNNRWRQAERDKAGEKTSCLARKHADCEGRSNGGRKHGKGQKKMLKIVWRLTIFNYVNLSKTYTKKQMAQYMLCWLMEDREGNGVQKNSWNGGSSPLPLPDTPLWETLNIISAVLGKVLKTIMNSMNIKKKKKRLTVQKNQRPWSRFFNPDIICVWNWSH